MEYVFYKPFQCHSLVVTWRGYHLLTHPLHLVKIFHCLQTDEVALTISHQTTTANVYNYLSIPTIAYIMHAHGCAFVCGVCVRVCVCVCMCV